MKILKFGGSSVADATNINKVIDIILESQKNEEGIIVVSALGGVTDALITLAKSALQGEPQWPNLFSDICKRHTQVIEELINSKDQKRVLEEVEKRYSELEQIIKKVSLNKELSPQILDAVMSFGEQLSAYIISEAIKSRGVPCVFVDSRTVIKTDDTFGEGNVDIETSYKLVSNYFKNNNQELSVMGGFIASTKDSITTTLGRGGSDYTASLVGAALNASVIEIWTDVDGLMTADPRKVKDAHTIPEISYEVAEEMALSGAKVIHPKTMKPARIKNIPIYIKNTFNPKGAYTRISNEKAK